MKIIFIGAGNVATHLATELYKQQHSILQIYSRTSISAEVLAQKVDAEPITNIRTISPDADIYIFSVKDSILQELISQLPENKGIYIHTAGSLSINIFEGYAKSYGIFYPFQTFSKNREIEWENIPIFIEASDQDTLNRIKSIAEGVTQKVIELSSEKRKYLHLTGVFACNFVNYMYTISEDILAEIDLPFDVVLPLIEETCQKVHSLNPIEAQTGPAIRFDKNIIDKHLSLIHDKKVNDIYRLISEKIYETHKDKLL